jgi:hypothetical protein
MERSERRAWRTAVLAAAVTVGLAAGAARASTTYPSCSACTSHSGSGDACWSTSARVLGTCGEEGLCANKACAGPARNCAQAITRYIQNKGLTGCAGVHRQRLTAKECTAALVVLTPPLPRCRPQQHGQPGEPHPAVK